MYVVPEYVSRSKGNSGGTCLMVQVMKEALKGIFQQPHLKPITYQHLSRYAVTFLCG